MVQKMTVALDSRSYPILVGPDAWAEGAALLPPAARICVISDDNVSSIYIEKLSSLLKDKGHDLLAPFILPAGEESKNWRVLEDIVAHLLSVGADRKTFVLALGGGVVGDIAGFAASITMRGIGFIQVPTTLLAQVDSSVGGKTGINTAQGKNLAGSFYQPSAVWIDPSTLSTLPMREFKAGYAEVLKYSLINDPAFFGFLEQNSGIIFDRDPAALEHIILQSCRSKAAIVQQDECEESGLRALLNLGHSFGHALEALGGYDGRLLHGEAVAIGMLMAAGFSEGRGICPVGTVAALQSHMDKAGLVQQPPFPVNAAEMLALMKKDKKASRGKIQLVLMRGIGNSFLEPDIDENELAGFLQAWLGKVQ